MHRYQLCLLALSSVWQQVNTQQSPQAQPRQDVFIDVNNDLVSHFISFIRIFFTNNLVSDPACCTDYRYLLKCCIVLLQHHYRAHQKFHFDGETCSPISACDDDTILCTVTSTKPYRIGSSAQSHTQYGVGGGGAATQDPSPSLSP